MQFTKSNTDGFVTHYFVIVDVHVAQDTSDLRCSSRNTDGFVTHYVVVVDVHVAQAIRQICIRYCIKRSHT